VSRLVERAPVIEELGLGVDDARIEGRGSQLREAREHPIEVLELARVKRDLDEAPKRPLLSARP
jgi:hypothetical protein